MDTLTVIKIIVRFAHIAGAIAVLGGLARAQISGAGDAPKYAPWLGGGALVLVASGIAQFIERMSYAAPAWHAIAGIKILLALHVVAVALVLARGKADEVKRDRLTRGAVVSGWMVVLLGAVLHTL
jgi:hypothetical protein